MKKHLIYAEDLVYEIMQHPSKTISKRLIKDCADRIVAEKPVSIWQYICDYIKGWFCR